MPKRPILACRRLFCCGNFPERAQDGEKDAVLSELHASESECLESLGDALDDKKDFPRARELARELLFLRKLAADLGSS